MLFKKYITVFLLLFLFIFKLAYAHNHPDPQEAKGYFFAAVTAYEKKQYDDALHALDKVKKILGKNNARTLALKVKVYYAQGQYTSAKSSLRNFYRYKAKESLQKEMSSYLLKIDKKLEQQREQKKLKKLYQKINIYGNRYREQSGAALTVLNDNSIVLLGTTESKAGKGYFDVSVLDAMVVKIDRKGNQIFQRILGGDRIEWPSDIDKTPDGGFIFGGYRRLSAGGEQLRWLVKMDRDGNKVWDKTYDRGFASSLKVLPDGGVILVGLDAIQRVDKNGNVVWTRTYKKTPGFTFVSVTAHQNGTFTATAYLKSKSESIIIHFDKDGKQLWRNIISRDCSRCKDNQIINDANNGLILAGHTTDKTIQILKYNDKTELVWKRTIDIDIYADVKSLVKMANGNLAVLLNAGYKCTLIGVSRKGKVLFNNAIKIEEYQSDFVALGKNRFGFIGVALHPQTKKFLGLKEEDKNYMTFFKTNNEAIPVK